MYSKVKTEKNNKQKNQQPSKLERNMFFIMVK